MVDEQKLRQLAEAASQGDWEHCILDRPLDTIAEYVGECIKKSGGDEFHFVIGQHPDGGGADLCHTGNGQKSSDNADWIAAANPAAILSLLDELQTLREERTAWRVTAENAEKDAARYAQVRRGQRWSVVDGIGNLLRGDDLDAAADQAIKVAMKDES